MVAAKTKDSETRLHGRQIGLLHAHEADAVVGALGRAMRDSPAHVAAYGADPEVQL
ncbi:MAG: hypothetical protein M3Q03_08765 [Chloroflexota bacterium]|nr:hypothetical protein [Chloroflexota bacterium]